LVICRDHQTGLAIKNANINDAQKLVLLGYLATAVKRLNGSIEIDCAWQV
jgi:hypothetical protein